MQTKVTMILQPLCPKFPIEQYLNRELTPEEIRTTKNHTKACRFCQKLPEENQNALFQVEVNALVQQIEMLCPKVQQMEADGVLDQWVIDNKLSLVDIFDFESSFGVRIGQNVKNRFYQNDD